MMGGGGGLGGEAGRPPALSARAAPVGANLGYLHALHGASLRRQMRLS